ncbi:MAG: carboxypeptidase regulatory-like domain-containing protein [Deltaproteobacteria bacterium]|nr:carboxypeptidase regulatory-like domain-containing protein [Deltaproteobacteria bacterium]MDQ3295432.1 carboxypeptidase regulatory-like domain-containing protein [Myxococcota bacterium]
MRRIITAGVVVLLLVAAVIAWRTCGSSSSGTTARAGSASATTQTSPGGRRVRDAKPLAPASLSGRVARAGDGTGIAGAVVSIGPASLMAMIIKADARKLVVVTDANGAWEAKAVIPGVYIVAATASGFLPAEQRKLVVAAGERRGGVDLALTAGGAIVKGTVTDVGGGPIADAHITAVESGMPELSGSADYTAISKADGTYEITLPDDDFTLRASHDDYVPGAQEIEVAGKPLTVDFELIPGARIIGQVIARENNQPVPNALIRATGGRGGRGSDQLVRTDDTGTFTLHGLGSGQISLHAMASGYATANPTEVALGIGEQVSGVRVYVDRAFSISGRVVKKGTQDGLAGVMLGAISLATQQFGLAPDPTASDGSFEIIGVRPATYMLFAVGEGAVPDIGKNVEVVDKDVTDVVIELAIGATLTGRVEPPLAGAAISIELEGDIGLGNMFDAAKTFLVHGKSDGGGAFVLQNVPAGKFRIVAKAPEGQTGTLPVTITDADQNGLVVKLEARASISGRVIDTSGAAVNAARVSVRSATPDKTFKISFSGGGQSATTAPDGSFRVVGIEPGKVKVRAGADRDEQIESMRYDKPGKATVELDLVAGSEKTGITLTVEARDGVIRGIVTSPDGKPASDAWVTATKMSDDDDGKSTTRSRGWGSSSPPVLTSAEGRFVISKLRRGTYQLVVDGPRGGTRAEKAGVKTGDTVTITLARLGTLTGKVTLGGAPVADFDIACDGPSDKTRHVAAADGAYTLESLAPGKYECTIDSASGSTQAELEVPAGPVTHDFALARWATISGTVIHVLTKQPVPGVFAFAGGGTGSTRNLGSLLTGRAPTTDQAGKFLVPRVAAGKGELHIMGKDGFAPAAKRDYTVTEGQALDLGTIAIVPPRVGDAGTFGFATTVDGDKLVVSSVHADGPAAAAGMREGDRLVSINGRSIAELTPQIAKTVLESGVIGVGMPAKIALDRNGTPLEVMLVSIRW